MDLFAMQGNQVLRTDQTGMEQKQLVADEMSDANLGLLCNVCGKIFKSRDALDFHIMYTKLPGHDVLQVKQWCNEYGFGRTQQFLRIGKCGAGQELISCTAGGNYLNYNILEYRYCIPTESDSISIACDQKADSYSSCNPRKFQSQRLLNCAIT